MPSASQGGQVAAVGDVCGFAGCPALPLYELVARHGIAHLACGRHLTYVVRLHAPGRIAVIAD